jgi:hypothetical protein
MKNRLRKIVQEAEALEKKDKFNSLNKNGVKKERSIYSKIFDKLLSLSFVGVGIFLLKYFNFFQRVMNSNKVNPFFIIIKDKYC